MHYISFALKRKRKRPCWSSLTMAYANGCFKQSGLSPPNCWLLSGAHYLMLVKPLLCTFIMQYLSYKAVALDEKVWPFLMSDELRSKNWLSNCKTNLKQGAHIHQPTGWPVPCACAQRYHPGSGSHRQLFRPYWGWSAWHSRRVNERGKSPCIKDPLLSFYKFSLIEKVSNAVSGF